MLSTLAVVAILVSSILIAAQRKASKLPRPPGPRGYPLIGNVFDKGGPWEWRLFSEKRARWGDITSVDLFGTTVVTLHTYEKAVEFLDKRSNIHSSRSQVQMFVLGGLEDHIAMLPYGTQLRECRRMLRSELNKSKLENYNRIQESATARLVLALLSTPERFYDRIEWYTASFVLKMVYGYETQEEDDPMIYAAHHGLAMANKASEPGYLIELIPWLRYVPSWFPYAEFRKTASKLRKDHTRMRELPFEYTTKRLDADDEHESFVSNWLKRISSPEQVQYAKESAMVSFSAGVETTSGALLSFIFKMQEYPAIQKQAQMELDTVVGRNRLPVFDDRSNLLYIDALCKEVLRFHPPLPLGLPHLSTSDDVQDEYFIAKGSLLIPSVVEMSRDPTVYKDPDTFNPSRFLGPEPERDPTLYVFGFGRRICPGLVLAQNTMFIAMSMMLASFDISATKDTPSTMAVQEGLVSHPHPFPCTFTIRPGTDVEGLKQRLHMT